jgi:hypothetical protein
MEQKQKQVSDYTGEELATILNEQYNVLLRTQANIQAVNMELDKRKTATESKEDKK